MAFKAKKEKPVVVRRGRAVSLADPFEPVGAEYAEQADRERALHDNVQHPAHYTAGSIECLDAIEAALGARGFADHLRGQVIKYNWRLALKGSAPEDAAKAEFYAKRLALHLQKHPNLYAA